MKILFLKDLDKVAKRGDIIEVKNGFARNLLIPKGIAVAATGVHLKQFEEQQKTTETRQQKRVLYAQDIRNKLSKTSITIPTKAGQDDKLFGAVTSDDIAKAIFDQVQVEIDRHEILLDQPIKKLGIYKVNVHLTADVKGEVKIWVVREQ